MDEVSRLPAKNVQDIADLLSPVDIRNALEVSTAWNQAFGSSIRCLSPVQIKGTKLFHRFPKLQRLDLASVTGSVSDSDLQQLAQLRCLKSLRLCGCSTITNLTFLQHLTGTSSRMILPVRQICSKASCSCFLCCIVCLASAIPIKSSVHQYLCVWLLWG